jgi:hypothetical protein
MSSGKYQCYQDNNGRWHDASGKYCKPPGQSGRGKVTNRRHTISGGAKDVYTPAQLEA